MDYAASSRKPSPRRCPQTSDHLSEWPAADGDQPKQAEDWQAAQSFQRNHRGIIWRPRTHARNGWLSVVSGVNKKRCIFSKWQRGREAVNERAPGRKPEGKAPYTVTPPKRT